MPGPDPAPVAGAAAYARQDRDARLSQAAIVLSLGAAAAGLPERVDRPDAIGLPADLTPLGRPEPIPLDEAVAPLGISADEQRARSGPAIPAETRVALMDQVVADPNPTTAAALVEACLHSSDRLVRTSAAVSALDTTGPRDDVVAQLVDGAHPGPRHGEGHRTTGPRPGSTRPTRRCGASSRSARRRPEAEATGRRTPRSSRTARSRR